MRGLVCWLMCLSVGCAEIADLRDDPTLIECVAANLGTPGLCDDAKKKCTVVEPTSGTVGCGPRGTGSPYAGCEDDAQCEDGTFCDRDWTTCKPFCTGDADCSGGKCLPATDGGVELGFRLCAAMCNPVDATKCGEGAACFLRTASPVPIWDCGGSLGLKFGPTGCDEAPGDRPCANGLDCIGGRCQKLCFFGDPEPRQCKTTQCATYEETAVFDGKQVGGCY